MEGIKARDIGKEGSKRYFSVVCPNCKKSRWVATGNTRIKGYTGFCKPCCGIERQGEKSSQWKGGRKIHRGYISVYAREHPLANVKGYVLEHRLAAAEKWGVQAIKGKHVHHKDGNIQNNDIENLEILTISEHTVLHNGETKVRMRRKGEPNPIIICACGCGEKTPKYNKNNYPRKFIWRHQNISNLGRFYRG